MAPLIDMIFILLVFFLMTTTFTRDTGLAVDRPVAATASVLEGETLRFSITPSGAIYAADGERVTLEDVNGRVARFVESQPGGAVIVAPDQRCPSGRLVQVMDAARAAGALDVAVATRRPAGEGS